MNDLNTQRAEPSGRIFPARFYASQPKHLLLDAVKARLGLTYDAQLAERLLYAPPQISKIRHKRHGDQGAQDRLLLSIHEETGWSFPVLRKLLKDSL